MNTPYPEHTPPAPPEGMKWEYRGMGWNTNYITRFYVCPRTFFQQSRGDYTLPLGHDDLHYFEAVPDRWSVEHQEMRDKVASGNAIENPKESAGRKKCPMHLLPSEFLIQTANVLGHGAYDAPKVDGKKGYGPWNWRDQPIKISTYLSAILRHWSEIQSGNMTDESHGQSHFASIAANCAIILDAMKQGTLVDDIPRNNTKP